MKILMGTVAALGALAIGGIPSVALTVAQAEHRLSTTTPGDAAQDAADRPGNGPPAHASSRHNGRKENGQKENGQKDKAREDQTNSPKEKEQKPDKGAARGKANKHAERMSALGREHGRAMREWAACVGEHAGRKAACGAKPTPPGHLKRRLNRHPLDS